MVTTNLELHANFLDQPFIKIDLLFDSYPFEQIGIVVVDALEFLVEEVPVTYNKNHFQFHLKTSYPSYFDG